MHWAAGKGTVYDFFVNAKTGKFQPWAEVVQDVQYSGTQAMSSVFVPTAETSSLRFFLDLMVDLHKPIMFVGGERLGLPMCLEGTLSTSLCAVQAMHPGRVTSIAQCVCVFVVCTFVMLHCTGR